jgi:hypothetical protein
VGRSAFYPLQHPGQRLQGRSNTIILRSATLEAEQLEQTAALLRGSEQFMLFQVAQDFGAASCIPEFANPDLVRYAGHIGFQELVSNEVTDIRDSRVHVPAAAPWHMREAAPPAPLRQGNWMVDLFIDRLTDHCRYANLRHSWLLPRRLRIEQSFRLERQRDRSQDFELTVLRVLRGGAITLPLNVEQTTVSITVPDDLTAFRHALCADVEWLPFERYRKGAPTGRQRYRSAELSDKGRYQLGLIERFSSVTDAFEVLMNGYWRDVLLRLGAVPAEKNTGLRDQLVRRLRGRLAQPQGALSFTTPEDIEKLAREAIRIGRQLQREDRFVTYGKLKEDWDAIVTEAEKQYGTSDPEEDAFYREVRHLDNSIKYLPDYVLFSADKVWYKIGTQGYFLRV